VTQRRRRPVVIDGANELTPRGLWWVMRHWPALRKEMINSNGYLWHHYYFRFPGVLGLMSFWESKGAAYKFAHKPVHKSFWGWSEHNKRQSRGGWLAIYEYSSGGVLWGNGVTKVRQRFQATFDAVDDETNE
jgi:hypothetical protein